MREKIDKLNFIKTSSLKHLLLKENYQKSEKAIHSLRENLFENCASDTGLVLDKALSEL